MPEPAPIIATPISRGPHVSDARIHIVVGDIHCPYQDRVAIGGLFDYLRELRPHGIVYNGDVLDFLEISRYSNGSVAQLEGKRFFRTFAEGNALLDAFRDAAGSRLSEQHFCEGNHERRVQSWLENGGNAVFADDEAFSIAARLRFKERGIVDHGPYPQAHVKLGHLIVTHGRWTNRYSASKHLQEYGHSVLINHVHSPQVYYGPGLTSQRVCYVNGHLADVTSAAMSYAPQPNAWAQGFCEVHVRKSGTFFVKLHTMWEQAFTVGDRIFGGRWA